MIGRSNRFVIALEIILWLLELIREEEFLRSIEDLFLVFGRVLRIVHLLGRTKDKKVNIIIVCIVKYYIVLINSVFDLKY